MISERELDNCYVAKCNKTSYKLDRYDGLVTTCPLSQLNPDWIKWDMQSCVMFRIWNLSFDVKRLRAPNFSAITAVVELYLARLCSILNR